PEAFRKNPQFVWSWYRERRIRMEKVNFGPSHKALAELEPLFPQFTLITQNIDGLHTKAGNKNVIELHGNIWYDRCARCDYKNSYSLELEIPKCRICGGIMRPDVVWFNEQVPQSALNEALDAALNSDFFIIIGTSALVQPAASLPIIAKENGALVLEINPSQTPLTFIANWSLRQKSIDILPHLTQTIKKILKK
ncbi:MAG: SIR2 family NAD-dependent protein deacylase, partial [bacterium]